MAFDESLNWELPPRARRIPSLSLWHYLGMGTTSACAENTLGTGRPEIPTRNYLRVRGEYVGTTHDPATETELPPRARRIHLLSVSGQVSVGTTSACAENTADILVSGSYFRNYLRVRGEYPFVPPDSILVPELPPRARRILFADARRVGTNGTTSACAENTPGALFSLTFSGNYLRVRGEYVESTWYSSSLGELPPRARRIPSFRQLVDKFIGTTSACAENT